MSLIDSGNTWLLLAVMTGTVALGVWLEGRCRWAAKVSALVIVLLLSILFSNVHLIPAKAPAYDFVWDYCLPLALPLLLFQSDVRKICRESGHLLVAFLIGAAGTVAGSFVSYALFRSVIAELPGLTAMMTGTYIGGSVNFAILSSIFHVSGTSVSAATIADNLNMAIYFLVLLAIPVKSKAVVDKQNELISYDAEKERKALSVKKLSAGIALSITIIAFSDLISGTLADLIPASNDFSVALQTLCGNRYLWITTCSVVLATVFAKQMKKLSGLQEVGTFFIYCFMFVIGAPASVSEILRNSPLLLVFALVIVAFNMLFTFFFGSLLRMDRKMLIIASNANIGGPTTAASMAIAKGWEELIGPALLCGCLGYVIGNYLGILVGNILL